MKTRPLTAFQSLMRGWAELAPYNFIHAIRLAETADSARWHRAIERVLAPLGIERFTLETTEAGIDAHLETELNRGFAADAEPLRFFLLPLAQGGHWLGATIDHWLLDDFSCRLLLERILANYRSPNETTPLSWTTAWPRVGRLSEWRSFFQQTRALRSAARVSLGDTLDLQAGTFRIELPAKALETARRIAREADATVHDIFLAAAAQACGASGHWPPRNRRNSIGLASAMDLRRFARDDEKNGFGFLIAQYTVVVHQPEQRPLAKVAAEIARTTRRLKAVTGAPVFAAGFFFWRHARSRHARANLFQRGAPLAAGLSNVNLAGSWLENEAIRDFRRVGPAGPVVPLVLMITTLRGRVSVDVTYRTTAFTRDVAERIANDFSARLV